MAKISISMLALAVSIATMLQTSSAQVTCYSCNSLSDSNCADTFKAASSIGTCTGAQCSKSWTSATGTVRGCVPIAVLGNTCTLTSGLTACYCNSNNCNSATGLHPGHVTGAILVAAALALTFIGRRLL